MKTVPAQRIWILPVVIAAIVVLSTLAVVIATVLQDADDRSRRMTYDGRASIPTRIFALTSHDSIFINGDSGFTNASGVVWGSGSESDPFIIEGWDINASSADGIRIWGSDAHFIIKDCYIHDGMPNYYGIYTEQSNNGTVASCVFTNDLWGVWLYRSAGVTIDNNTFSNCQYGIRCYDTASITMVNNTCTNNEIGVILFYPVNLVARNNNISMNTDFGLFIQSDESGYLCNNAVSQNGDNGMELIICSNTTVRNVTCHSNAGAGISLSRCHNITVSECLIANNSWYGACVYYAESSDNCIWNNTFYHNRGSGDFYNPSVVQACDEGTGDCWNSSYGYGNFWSDWTGPDGDGNGIVDLPYEIAGSAAAKDYYPRTPAPPIPEFGMLPLLAATIIGMVLVMRRRLR